VSGGRGALARGRVLELVPSALVLALAARATALAGARPAQVRAMACMRFWELDTAFVRRGRTVTGISPSLYVTHLSRV